MIRKFKRGKAPGPDNITTDWAKDLRGQNLEDLRTLINEWWISKHMPENIATARVVSLYKKGNPDLQENYRPISLLNTYYKIIASCIQNRLAEALDKKLMKTQYGFREQKSTIDAIFITRRLQEYAERRGNKGLMLLLDWEKAFDKVSHEWLFKSLEAMNIPRELMDLIRELYRNPYFYVEIDKKESKTAKQATGIRQGCP